MIGMYCRDVHGTKSICPDCVALRDYAMSRLDKCPFGEGKTVCSLCLVHCYQPEMRLQIKSSMRHAGPRMMTRHPVLAMQHLMDKRRKAPLTATKADC